jgi:hypothetical protein
MKINYKIGDLIKGSAVSARYYKNCGINLLSGKIISIEERSKSVMLSIQIIEHENPKLIGRRFLVNQAYMIKISDNKDEIYDYEGNLSKKTDTIEIEDRIYTKNLNAFYIRGKWFEKNSPEIALNSLTDKYDLRRELTNGYIGKNMKGFFTFDDVSIVSDVNGNRYMNKAIALENGLTECVFDGNLYKDKRTMPKARVAYRGNDDSFGNLTKDPRYAEKFNLNKLRLGEDSSSYRISGGYKGTFGVELETSIGRMPRHVVVGKGLNIKCMRDGSITGGEYVTGILKGDTGFENLHKTLVELSKRCAVDNRTGLHVHIGGVDFDKSFVVFAYMLAKKMERSLQSMLPSTRRGNSNAEWGVRGDGKKFKDLCKDLPDIDFTNFYKLKDEMTADLWKAMIEEYYGKIYSILTSGSTPPKGIAIGDVHPAMRTGGNRWIPQRYYWFNLIPCCFSNVRSDDEPRRGAFTPSKQTIEFRNHPGSLNYEKVKNWILICMAFTKYVQDNKKDILDMYKKEISFDTIINAFFSKSPEKAEQLLVYINERINVFSKNVKNSYGEDDLLTKEKTLKQLCA